MPFFYFFGKPKTSADGSTISFTRKWLGIFGPTITVNFKEDPWAVTAHCLVTNERAFPLTKAIEAAITDAAKECGAQATPALVSKASFFGYRYGAYIYRNSIRISHHKSFCLDNEANESVTAKVQEIESQLRNDIKKNCFYANNECFCIDKKCDPTEFATAMSQTAIDPGTVYVTSRKSLTNWIMLGKETVYNPIQSSTYKDIQYLDAEGLVGKKKVNLGGPTLYQQLSLPLETVNALTEDLISHGAPIAADGETFSPKITFLNPMTWFRREKLTIGQEGIRYWRPKGFSGSKTSYIPYENVYLINTRRKWLFWKTVHIYGSQNVESNRWFSSSRVSRLKKTISEKNPSINLSEGYRYGNFSWNPFKGRYRVITTDKGLAFRHPHNKKELLFVPKESISEVEKFRDRRGIIPFLFFRHVIITATPNNIRYDEYSKDNWDYTVQINPKYKNLHKKLNEYNESKGSKLIITIPHMFMRSASSLESKL